MSVHQNLRHTDGDFVLDEQMCSKYRRLKSQRNGKSELKTLSTSQQKALVFSFTVIHLKQKHTFIDHVCMTTHTERSKHKKKPAGK